MVSPIIFTNYIYYSRSQKWINPTYQKQTDEVVDILEEDTNGAQTEERSLADDNEATVL